MQFSLNDIHILAWNEISYMDFDIDNSVAALRSLNFNQEKALNNSREELDAKISQIKESNKDSKDFIDAYIHHLTQDDEVIMDEIARLQRYSIVMSIHAFCEARLKSICSLIETEFEFPIKLNELSTSKGDLNRYWIYLTKIYGIQPDLLLESFGQISIQKKLRNIITHKDGIISVQEMNSIPKPPGVSVNKYGDINVLKFEANTYIDFLLKIIKQFFTLLLKEVDKRYKELKEK